MRHELMDFMFADPTMLDDLEYLFKSDMARSLLFFYQATHMSSLEHFHRLRIIQKRRHRSLLLVGGCTWTPHYSRLSARIIEEKFLEEHAFGVVWTKQQSIHLAKYLFFYSSFSSNHPGAKSLVQHSIPSANQPRWPLPSPLSDYYSKNISQSYAVWKNCSRNISHKETTIQYVHCTSGWSVLALLYVKSSIVDQDPYSEYGSGSTQEKIDKIRFKQTV